jgi:hypothetical protein
MTRRRAHLINPEEPRVERRTAIFLKEVCKTLEHIVTLEGFEKSDDYVEISGPATAHTGDGLGAQADGFPVLDP